MKDISLVIPALNEEESLPYLIKAIDDVLIGIDKTYEVIVIDDGSSDTTFAVLQKLHAEYNGRIRGRRFNRNYGKAAALSVGIKIACGDVIITMDADLQDDPKAIPDMLKLIDEGWDVVSGWKKRRLDPVLSKNIPSKFFNFVTSIASGLKLHDFNCGFKAYRASAAKSLEIYGERHRYLPALAHWNGFKVTEVAVPHHKRKYGETKYGLDRFYKGFFDLLTLVFLKKYMKNPLHFFGMIGIFFLLFGSAILTYFGIDWIITREMHIRPLILFAGGAILMGIQFVSIGLIGEMITNTYRSDDYLIRDSLD